MYSHSPSFYQLLWPSLQCWYLEKRSNSKGSVVEISKIQSVCLDKNSEDRLLYLMMGPGLPSSVITGSVWYTLVSLWWCNPPMNEALPSLQCCLFLAYAHKEQRDLSTTRPVYTVNTAKSQLTQVNQEALCPERPSFIHTHTNICSAPTMCQAQQQKRLIGEKWRTGTWQW